MEIERIKEGMKVVPFKKSGSRFINYTEIDFPAYVKRANGIIPTFLRENGFLFVKEIETRSSGRKVIQLCTEDKSSWNLYRSKDLREFEIIEEGQYCLMF